MQTASILALREGGNVFLFSHPMIQLHMAIWLYIGPIESHLGLKMGKKGGGGVAGKKPGAWTEGLVILLRKCSMV